jgi:hypothetical protein
MRKEETRFYAQMKAHFILEWFFLGLSLFLGSPVGLKDLKGFLNLGT